MRPSWVEVDLEAIGDNIRAFVDLVSPAAVCTVVKADAYGHGDVPVAETALEAGAEWLAVALVEEAVRLREAGLEAPILLLSEPAPEDVVLLPRWRVTPTVYRSWLVEALEETTGPAGAEVHVKVDTGMHRVGAPPGTVPDLARRIQRGTLRLAGLWTHLAVAEEDAAFTAGQVRCFEEVVERLLAVGMEVGTRHLANTAGAILHPAARGDMVRVGLGTYGLYPSEECRRHIRLRPAMRVVSHVAHLARYPAGTRLSYGRRIPLASDATVATVPVGYADGVPRILSARGGEVLVGGRRRPLAGTVTMDQMMVVVGDDDVRTGDEVVLIGRQGDEEIGADEWAERTGTISYEIVCGIGPRLPRRYGGS